MILLSCEALMRASPRLSHRMTWVFAQLVNAKFVASTSCTFAAGREPEFAGRLGTSCTFSKRVIFPS